MSEPVIADSWTALQELLFAESWNPRLRRYRSTCAFRGTGVTGRDLRTGVARLGGDYARKERHLIRNFRKYARRSFVGDDSVWNWLALAQHHGLPTRLLDWTYSPLVALHFATSELEHFEVDGEVWLVDYSRTNRVLPGALRQLLEREGSDVFTGEMLSGVARSLHALQALADEAFVLFLEPPSLNDRIVNQSALFSLMSTPAARLDEWLDAHSDAYRRVIVPASLKWEVRDKLDQANVSERVLFPGLDGLSAWLRRYYTER
ncbi:MAG: FRG domain-containing protein [Longimicrobiales bacterium]